MHVTTIRLFRSLSLMLVLTVGVAPLTACRHGGKPAADSAAETENASPSHEKMTNVEVLQVRPSDFVDHLELTGTAEPWKSVTIASEIGGKLEYLGLVEGHNVKQGQVIARVNARLLAAQKEQAVANYHLAQVQEKWQQASAKRQVSLAESNYDLSSTNFGRQQNLYQQQVLSAQNFDSAQNNLHNSKAQLDLQKISQQSTREVNQQQVRLASANLQVARENLAKAVMTSPLNGYVNKVMVEAGEVVSPGAPMAEVIQTQQLKIGIGVPEQDIGSIKMGQEVQMHFDAFPDQDFTGTVIFIAAAAEPASRTFPVKLRLNNPGLKIRGGMIARVKLERDRLTDQLVVPRDAIMDTKDARYLFVEEKGRAVRRMVTLGRSQGTSVVVNSGLKAGDAVIVTGNRNLRDGDKINVHRRLYQGASPAPSPTAKSAAKPSAKTNAKPQADPSAKAVEKGQN